MARIPDYVQVITTPKGATRYQVRIEASQIVQESVGRVVLKVVRDVDYARRKTRRCLCGMHRNDWVPRWNRSGARGEDSAHGRREIRRGGRAGGAGSGAERMRARAPLRNQLADNDHAEETLRADDDGSGAFTRKLCPKWPVQPAEHGRRRRRLPVPTGGGGIRRRGQPRPGDPLTHRRPTALHRHHKDLDALLA